MPDTSRRPRVPPARYVWPPGVAAAGTAWYAADWTGDIAHDVADALCERAQAGLKCDVIIDAIGGNTVVTDGDISAHPEFKPALWASRSLPIEVARATTMYTSTHPCEMCAGAIARSGLGRVVFALSPEQHDSILPPGHGRPHVAYEGPSLFEEARVPIDGYYD